jgi:putative endonuclease
LNRKAVGERGEKLARRFLERQGCRVLETNHRSRLGEIDIVCRQGGTIVFVEVKTRTSTRYGRPAEAVTLPKQERLHRLAQEYLIAHGLEDSDVRFDVLAIELGPSDEKIEHIPNAF